MKNLLLSGAMLALMGCANHPLDCAIGLIAWDDCLPGTKGYDVHQQSLRNLSAVRAEKAATDDAVCQSYGAKPGSDAYVSCRVQRDK